MSKLTQAKLKELLHYDPDTGIFTRKIRTANCVQVGDVAGHHSSDGYIHISILNKSYRAHRLAWLYIYGYFPEHGLDHKDKTRHHNWILNLREASQQCNSRNCGNPKSNTSGVKGIWWRKQRNKWQVQIKINYKKHYFGLYKSFDNAVCARLAGEQCLNWLNCDSNSPAFQYVKNNINSKAKG